MVVYASYPGTGDSPGEPLLGYLAATLYLIVLEYGMRANVAVRRSKPRRHGTAS
jgi:hypothetical protein